MKSYLTIEEAKRVFKLGEQCHQQPLLGFTPEETEIIKHFLTCDREKLLKEGKSLENDIMLRDLDHILNRIKVWDAERNNGNSERRIS